VTAAIGRHSEPLLHEVLTATLFNIGSALGHEEGVRSMTSLIAMIRDDELLPVKVFVGLYLCAISSLILASILF
jgi:hypothetical protein